MIALLVDLINLIIKAVGIVITTIINILPTSPFLLVDNIELPYLSELNWVIPFNLFLSILGYWIGAIAVYYGVQIILRWVKVIQ